MIIDFHTHAFPEKIAPRAMEKLAFASGGLVPQTDGTFDGLKQKMLDDQIDISVVLGIATNPLQQKNVNDFAAKINSDPSFVAFGSVHPDAKDALCELERIKSLGLKGVKFHPEYQNFFVDDLKMKPLYKKISQLGLITVFHAGYDYGFNEPFHCMPSNLQNALKWFDSAVVAAHWGGLGCTKDVLDNLAGMDIWFDLSFGYGAMPKSFAQKILDKHTPDRLLFASDMPWHRPSWEKRLIETLDISQSDRDKIYFKNAAKLLDIDVKF
ncbi:MAG: amidohydrolase family protein [Clostridia bacterium]|nr:amidohydrolase family protein [Clostridia bacterium]